MEGLLCVSESGSESYRSCGSMIINDSNSQNNGDINNGSGYDNINNNVSSSSSGSSSSSNSSSNNNSGSETIKIWSAIVTSESFRQILDPLRNARKVK